MSDDLYRRSGKLVTDLIDLLFADKAKEAVDRAYGFARQERRKAKEEMREAAAKACEDLQRWEHPEGVIRALPIED